MLTLTERHQAARVRRRARLVQLQAVFQKSDVRPVVEVALVPTTQLRSNGDQLGTVGPVVDVALVPVKRAVSR